MLRDAVALFIHKIKVPAYRLGDFLPCPSQSCFLCPSQCTVLRGWRHHAASWSWLVPHRASAVLFLAQTSENPASSWELPSRKLWQHFASPPAVPWLPGSSPDASQGLPFPFLLPLLPDSGTQPAVATCTLALTASRTSPDSKIHRRARPAAHRSSCHPGSPAPKARGH